ncbi:stress response kinase A [Litchfieldella qijiaojingensis]|uniref:Stress response kinase A n=1 Tax=Litchfieldella qijiaojingensis TaxID=980347 RepID=A0ABQ2YPG1_9GAMM|nr:serine/threonine protein kinase [Halomonas qijiaojingensis]GGX90912.1 stress response kinase A [Halomonas qijiaojingensis]
MTASPHPFERLDPKRIVDAVESLGMWLPGEPFALNSYENRVFLVSDDERRRWVVKFYRPGRWSDAQILEEHDFLAELEAEGVPVGAPWRNDKGESLHHAEGFRFALFTQVAGQAPELENPTHLFALGDVIGQLHAVGKRRPFVHRRALDLDDMVRESREQVLSGPWMSRRQRRAYERISGELHAVLKEHAWSSTRTIRVHGDCHLGNILGRDEHFSLVDFDDCVMAPAVQDLWMLLTAQSDQEAHMQLAEIVEGYEQHTEFDRRELAWIEPLRSLRLIRHSAWLAARWEDPAFPRAFPWVAEESYWDAHIRTLEQQRQAMDERSIWLA